MGREAVRGIYASFSDGHGTCDLRAARAVLDTLDFSTTLANHGGPDIARLERA